MYAVKDDTETNFNIVLYIKVIFLGMGVGLSEPYPTKRGPLTTRLANDLSRKKKYIKMFRSFTEPFNLQCIVTSSSSSS